MTEVRPFFHDLALVLCVAAVAAVLFRRLRQSSILGYLLAGVVVGPHVPFGLIGDQSRIHALSDLGVVLVMFSIGLEFTARRFARVFPTAGLTGLVQISAMFWLGYLVGQLFGWSGSESLFGGAVIAISSTMVVAHTFADEHVEARLAELVFGVLVVEDLAAILLIALLTAVATSSRAPAGELVSTVAELVAFLGVLVAVGYLLVPRAIRMVARLRSAEALLIASIGLCFGMALLAQEVGFSVALGAFAAGALVAESGRGRSITRMVRPLRDLFGAVFFVSVGMLLDPGVILRHLPVVLALSAIVVIGQITFVSLGAFLGGNGVRTSIRAGMSLAQIGEFSFIIAGIGVTTGAIRPFLFSVAVAVAAATTFATPWLVRASRHVAPFVDRRLPDSLQTFASLYGSWLEELRAARGRRSRRSRVRRLAWLLAVDGAIIAGIIITTALAHDWLMEIASRVGLAAWPARVLIVAGALAAIAPFALGVLRTAHGLGATLALAALPTGKPGELDLAEAPRRAFIVTVQLAIVLVVCAPLLALTSPFVSPLYAAILLAALLAAAGVAFWRGAINLQGHVRAGAHVVIEALARQTRSPAPMLTEAEELLPGLGPLTPVRIGEDSPAQGKTLAEINLRGRTGANVIAIRRGDQGIVIPTGREVIEPGDILALTGTTEAVAAAAAALTDRDQDA